MPALTIFPELINLSAFRINLLLKKYNKNKKYVECSTSLIVNAQEIDVLSII